jgi:hypothetical protein
VHSSSFTTDKIPGFFICLDPMDQIMLTCGLDLYVLQENVLDVPETSKISSVLGIFSLWFGS